MTSRTGNRGFTLVEIMAAAVVLALGTLLVYRAFFSSLDAYTYYARYLKIAPLADEMLWNAQDLLGREGTAPPATQGEWRVNGKAVAWDLKESELRTQKGVGTLYRVAVSCAWREGVREAGVVRETHVWHYVP